MSAPHAATATPRYKPVGKQPLFWRAICAVCDGLLAELDHAQVRGDRGKTLYARGLMGPGMQEVDASARPPAGWVVSHPHAFSHHDDGSYRVIGDVATRTRRWGDRRHGPGGRRPMGSGAPFNVTTQGGYGIVGEFPTLPATINCPDCGRPHVVTGPPAP